MPDMGICQVYNPLPGGLEVRGVLVDCRDPAKRLCRWRDVVRRIETVLAKLKS